MLSELHNVGDARCFLELRESVILVAENHLIGLQVIKQIGGVSGDDNLSMLRGRPQDVHKVLRQVRMHAVSGSSIVMSDEFLTLQVVTTSKASNRTVPSETEVGLMAAFNFSSMI